MLSTHSIDILFKGIAKVWTAIRAMSVGQRNAREHSAPLTDNDYMAEGTCSLLSALCFLVRSVLSSQIPCAPYPLPSHVPCHTIDTKWYWSLFNVLNALDDDKGNACDVGLPAHTGQAHLRPPQVTNYDKFIITYAKCLFEAA